MTSPAAKPAVTAPPLPKPVSFFTRQLQRRRIAGAWAVLITAVSGLVAACVALLLELVVLLYVTLLSRLLPTRVGSMMAAGLEVVGGPIGLGITTLLLTALAWYLARRSFQRDTTAGLLGRLDARPVNPQDEAEQTLVKLIRHAAAQVGMPAPSVLFADGSWCNAAAVGDHTDRAGVLVSRESLDVLDAKQQRAVMAHLLASIANGDLRISDAVLRGFFVMGGVISLLDVPFSRHARTSLAVLVRHAFPRSQKPEQESDAIASAFVRTLQPDGLESLTIFLRKLVGEENDVRSIALTILFVLLLPVLLARLVGSVIYRVATLLLLGPIVTLIARGRRTLADATAAKLTKDAETVSGALTALYAARRVVPNVGLSELSFVVGPEAANENVFARLQLRVQTLLAEVNNYSTRLRLKSPGSVSTGDGLQPTVTASTNHEIVFGFHPPLAARLHQLQRLGAARGVALTRRRDGSTWIIGGVLLIGIGLVLVFALPALRR